MAVIKPRAKNGGARIKPRLKKSELEDKLRVVLKLQGRRDDASRKLNIMETELLTEMDRSRIKALTTEIGGVEATDTMGRGSTVIKPGKLFNILDKDDFFECVKVSIQEAKKMLTTIAFDKLAIVTEGKKGARTLKFLK